MGGLEDPAHSRTLPEFAAKLAEVDDPEWALTMMLLGAAGFRGQPLARGAKSGWPDLAYAQISDTYVTCLAAGIRSPIKEVAKLHAIKTTQARDAIHTARKRGILTPTTQRGRPGGQLTPAAEELLADAAKKKTKKKPTRRKTKKRRR